MNVAQKSWSTPKLESIDMFDTAQKVGGINESGQNTCGPANAPGGTPRCPAS